MREFEPGSEQFLAAVLYVARDAQKQWEKHKRHRGHLSRWWYLNRVRKRLQLLDPVDLSYAAMRNELMNFAESFGVVGADPNWRANRDAFSSFNEIEEKQ